MIRVVLLGLAALWGCAGLHAGDPLLQPLGKFLNRPVLNLAQFLGAPSGASGLLDRRRYRWDYRDPDGQTCSLIARVDEQEIVIDIQRSGAAPVCARSVEETVRFTR